MGLLDVPGKPVAHNFRLLRLNYGLLWGILRYLASFSVYFHSKGPSLSLYRPAHYGKEVAQMMGFPTNANLSSELITQPPPSQRSLHALIGLGGPGSGSWVADLKTFNPKSSRLVIRSLAVAVCIGVRVRVAGVLAAVWNSFQDFGYEGLGFSVQECLLSHGHHSLYLSIYSLVPLS